MASPSRETDAPVKVVLIDSTTQDSLARSLRQILRASRVGEVVVVSSRSVRLPAGQARRVRVVRAEVHLLEALASDEAVAPGPVVVAPTSCSFAEGWTAEVIERARRYPQNVSVLGQPGRSVLLLPAAVTSVHSPRVTWGDARCLRLRESAAAPAVHRTLSAVMIVKDEEEVLDECLEALIPFVDEVVVYDTGSSDRTVEIAHAHGVVVVEGYWNDNFGDARNRALEHATGDWIMQIDADEVMEGDVADLRNQLDTEQADQMSITILSTTFRGGTTGVVSQRPSFFVRGKYEWRGALHEYPVPLPGVVTTGMSQRHPAVRLVHSGYQPERAESRDKRNRNLALSSKELAELGADDPQRATMLSNQARTLMWADKVDEALEVFDELRRTPGNPTSIIMGGRSAVEALLNRQRFEDVEDWLEVMLSSGESPGNVAVYRARMHLTAGDADKALSSIADVRSTGGGCDIWGVPFDDARLDVVTAAAQMTLGDPRAATEVLMEIVRSAPDAVPFGLLLTATTSAGWSLEEVTAIAPQSLLERSLREASASHPVAALSWFEAYHATHPAEAAPVVAGNVFAARAGWRVAMIWAIRAVEHGLTSSNALLTLTHETSAPAVERCMAAALLAEYFSVQGMDRRFEELTASLTSDEEEQLVAHLAEVGLSASSVDLTADRVTAGSNA